MTPTEPKPCSSFIIEGPVRVQITVTEIAGGKLQVDVKVLDGAKTGDLRGVFFDVANEKLLSGLKVEGDDVTGAKFAANCVTSVGGRSNSANISGDVAKEFGAFDAGVLIGSAGVGKDDVQETSFVLSHATLSLTDDLLSAQDFAVRLTSVGVEGGARCDSLKLGATAPEFCGDPEPEPCDCVCDEKIDFNDLAKGTVVSDQYDGVTISANVTRQIAIHVEAEHMHRTGFTVASGCDASGDKLVKLSGNHGTLATTFSGPTGEYDVRIRVQDECDGRSVIALRIDGHVVKTFKLNADNNGAGSDNGGFNTVTLHDVDIPKGAKVELVATRDGHEFVRIDKVSFHGSVTENRAMIFDADHITGGDHDLRNGDGKVLIISEDGDGSDPDDNAAGGSFHFDFDKPAKVTSIDVIDTEEGGRITAYAADGSVIGAVDIPRLRDAEVRTVKLGFEGVAKLVVTLNGSGAVDDLCYDIPVVDPRTASLGDFVFFDANENGVFDGDDTAVEGVTVQLLDAAGDVLATDVTDAGGLYLFDGLAAGDYRVRFAAPAGLAFTTASAAPADTTNNDSDADAATGETGIVTLSVGEAERDVDAGLIQPNRAPVADDETAKVCSDASVVVDVLDGDSDADGDTLTITQIDGVDLVNGVATLASGAVVRLEGGKLVYDVSGAGDAFDGLTIGQTATDSFEYTIADGEGGATTGRVDVDLCGALNTLESISARLPDVATMDIDLVTNARGQVIGTNMTVDFAGRDDIDGVYVAYCIELPDPVNTAPTQALVYSSTETLPDRLIGEPGQDIDNPEFLDRVNYILNRDDLGSFTFTEIQTALRGLVTDEIDGAALTGGAGELWQDAIDFGAGFKAGAGDVIGLIFEPVDANGNDNGQVFIAALAFDALSEDCLCL